MSLKNNSSTKILERCREYAHKHDIKEKKSKAKIWFKDPNTKQWIRPRLFHNRYIGRVAKKVYRKKIQMARQSVKNSKQNTNKSNDFNLQDFD